METKQLNGKAIYSPKGKAGEYAKYACNFYVGCGNDCDYCYCKRGVLGHSMGKPQATLKKCFKNEEHALEVFKKELNKNMAELREHWLFFTFTSDPMIEECIGLTLAAVNYAVCCAVPCKILTKRGDFIPKLPEWWLGKDKYDARDYLAFGFTLTGCDELEPHASTNAERIECMRKLHDLGFKTFASIEPVIDLKSSANMIWQTLGFCDLYKIGLMSGGRLPYTWLEVGRFYMEVNELLKRSMPQPRVYWKDSVLKYIDRDRDRDRVQLFSSIFVNADYNMFKQETL